MLAERLTAQLLAGPPARDPLAVAERLLAIQGQDQRGARLAVRARSTGLTAADVDRALTQDRSLLITWLNRGTLHLVRSEDYPWLQALTTPPLRTGNARRLAQEGVSPSAADRGVATIERALAEGGPQTREQLRELVAAAGVPTERQALVHLLMLTCLRGIAVRGPMVGGRHAYVLVRDWLGEATLGGALTSGSAPRGALASRPAPRAALTPGSARFDRDRALAEMARRFLAGHGPADDRDLAKWAGLPLRDARAGLKAIAGELTQRPDGLVDLARRPLAAELPPPRLLGAYDPVLLGWRSREPLIGAHEGIVTLNGLFRAFALVRGRAAATWGMPGGEVVLEPFGRLARADRVALEQDGQDVVRFLGSGEAG